MRVRFADLAPTGKRFRLWVDMRDERGRVRVVTASVPRSCLGRPCSVQFRVLSEQVRRSWRYAWLDNGLAESMDDRRWTAGVRRG